MSSVAQAQEPRSVLAPPLPRRPAAWRGLHGAARALALAELARSHGGCTLVLVPDTLGAERMEQALRFFLRGSQVAVNAFPDWELLPYDRFSPYQDIISARLACLAESAGPGPRAIVVSIATLLHRLAPPDFVHGNSFVLSAGDRLAPEAFTARLLEAGYRRVAQVMEHGDYAQRGALIDVFPMGAARPFRLELFDEEIESIRLFDPETQRTLEKVETLRLLPAREFPLTDEAIACFRRGWRRRFPASANRSPIYTDVNNRLAPAGIEYYLPLFFEETACLLDYLGEDTVVALDEDCEARAADFLATARDRHERYRHDLERPLLPPEELFMDLPELQRRLEAFPRVQLLGTAGAPAPGDAVVEFASTMPVELPIDPRAREPVAALLRFLDREQRRVLLVAESEGRRETLLELLSAVGRRPALVAGWREFLDGEEAVALTVAPLDTGADLLAPPLAIIAESQLFGERAAQRRSRRRRRTDPDLLLKNLAELSVGAPVVHEDHGVGRFQGLVTLPVGGVDAEFIELRYADDDKLYVPVGSLDRLSRYAGPDTEHAPLHKLGSGQWQKARQKAARRIRDVAAELLDLQARRAARRGRLYDLDVEGYRSFAAAFPFDETPDQAAAIEGVIEDLGKEQPMDRLVCGDSGFGKTEVAMRAAFVTAMAGYQVAVLVPTTLLAQQHYENFRDRFADWPVRIEFLSRFGTAAGQRQVLGALEAGAVDIVIGTHKLLQPGVRFKNLGLVVIDEEHRFGVRQKERLKALRSEVNVLAMTATPIPRTLNMALSGIRELSLIATPPSRRIPVRTFVRQWDEETIREAMLREINRGGQVFFVHNEVTSIERTAEQLAALMPEARVRHAHGQMREQELERVMLDFYHRRFNVLVCSTIIETGIDIPSANTIIINRADKFGLAQLYQLRGRVGRSHHRAYAYLIVPHRKSITADALKRLEAIESLTELGLGFTLASQDLEIRGAGELLGEEQTGHIQAVGYSLYMEMLERAVAALKAGREPEPDKPLAAGADIELGVAALLPEDYVPDVQQRLVLYKRIASAEGVEAMRDLQEELVDRFGPLPEPAGNLLRIGRLKTRAVALGIVRAELGARGGRIHFREDAGVEPARLVSLIQEHQDRWRLDGPQRLRLSADMPEAEHRFEALEWLLAFLEAPAGNEGAK